jgi:hypothetical protein
MVRASALAAQASKQASKQILFSLCRKRIQVN